MKTHWRGGRPGGRSTRRPGQALVEFALIAPLLLLIILGMVEFARAWSAHHVIADAAREGARLSAIFDASIDATAVHDSVVAKLNRAGLNGPSANITVDDSGEEEGQPSEVYIEYPYTLTWLAPLMKWTSGEESITLRSRIVMRNE
jgi:Flp pilus assembly protein TadG